MVKQGEWLECMQPTTQSALPQHMSTSVASSGGLGVPIMETIACLLTANFEHKGNLKGSSVNRVLRIWLSHFQQIGSYITKMSDEDRDVLLITDPKIIQARMDAQPREKDLQAAAEEKFSSVSWASGRIQSQILTPRPLMCPPSEQRRTFTQPSPSWRRLGRFWMT